MPTLSLNYYCLSISKETSQPLSFQLNATFITIEIHCHNIFLPLCLNPPPLLLKPMEDGVGWKLGGGGGKYCLVTLCYFLSPF